jgi:hypothetical protein
LHKGNIILRKGNTILHNGNGIIQKEIAIPDYQTATLTNQVVVAGDETVADFEMVKAN